MNSDIVPYMPTYTSITEKFTFGGDCITKINGKNVFIPFAIPGETVEIEIEKEFPDYSIARLVNVVKASPHRVIPPCPLYGKCGGCSMQHISNEEQKNLRRGLLSDSFAREGIEVSESEINVVSGSPLGYRARFQFHNGGLMEKRTNRIIQLENCPCASPEINHYLKEVPSSERPEGRVHVFGSEKITSIPDGYDKLVIADEGPDHAGKKSGNKGYGKAQERTPGGRKLKKQKQIKPKFQGTVLNTANSCTVELCGKKITFDVQGFFQSNLEVLEKAIPLVTEGLSGSHVVDMYSGAGTFSTFLADSFTHVTLVEHNRDALVYAEQNMAGKGHESYGVSGEVWVKHHAQGCVNSHGKIDAVVIDPPRSGMEKAVCQWLCTSGIPQIRYVSCDPSTLARDSKFLIKAGYKLTKLHLLDFYPQTSHIESLACFSLQG